MRTRRGAVERPDRLGARGREQVGGARVEAQRIVARGADEHARADRRDGRAERVARARRRVVKHLRTGRARSEHVHEARVLPIPGSPDDDVRPGGGDRCAEVDAEYRTGAGTGAEHHRPDRRPGRDEHEDRDGEPGRPHDPGGCKSLGGSPSS